MADRVGLTLRESNDETVDLVVTAANDDDDLTDVASLALVMKPQGCDDDGDDAALNLSSDDPTEIAILTQTATTITAQAFIPRAALADPYDRVWRLDAISTSGARRTVIYGPVTVVNT